jgi:hypothetical protein
VGRIAPASTGVIVTVEDIDRLGEETARPHPIASMAERIGDVRDVVPSLRSR